MDKQLIINVGRQIGSGGLIIAKMLAKAFDCKFYDKEILNLAAQESGFSEKFFEKNDETKEYLRSRFHIHVPLLGESSFYSSDFSQEGLYKFQSEAIRKAAQEGRCVFVGRTADYILRDMKEKVDVFVTADLNDRIEAVAKRHGLSRTEAKKYIQNKEATRAGYYNYYTGKKWGAAESYDLCVNTSVLGMEQTAQFIEQFIRQRP